MQKRHETGERTKSWEQIKDLINRAMLIALLLFLMII